MGSSLPYEYDRKNKVSIIEEKQFKTVYPFAYNYLLENRELLSNRFSEKSNKRWYSFGKSQGLSNMNKEKLIISRIIKESGHENCLKVYKVNAETCVFSGLFITGENLNIIKSRLESEDFYKYACLVEKKLSGGYKTLSTHTINNFSLE